MKVWVSLPVELGLDASEPAYSQVCMFVYRPQSTFPVRHVTTRTTKL